MRSSCLVTENNLRTENRKGGSVGCFVATTQSKIVVANVGDCRCILVQFNSDMHANNFLSNSDLFDSYNDSEALEECGKMITTTKLSLDHKPNVPEEAVRIKASGLKVVGKPVQEKAGPDSSIYQIQLPPVKGSKGSKLSVSRAFGDFEYKNNTSIGPELQAVVAVPDVEVRERCPLDAFVILACDGVWDVLSNEGAAELVTTRTHHYLFSSECNDASSVLPSVGDDLLEYCLLMGSTDSLSVAIVALSSIADRISEKKSPCFDLEA
jgi:serine/threonine protein phosphatase PrpC